jgi:LSD1 subclass zinc finger protein
MDEDFSVNAPRSFCLANLSMELMSQIVAIVDAWDVGRLACTGNRKLLHLLSGARHLRHLAVDQSFIYLPNVISTFKNLKSLSISKYPLNGERIRIGDSALNLLQNLPRNMDSLRLVGLLNPFKAVLEPYEGLECGQQFRYRDLTSLEIEGSHRKHDLDCVSALERLPQNLTRLSLVLDIVIQSTSYHKLLPISLVELRLHFGNAPFIGPWMARLPQLTSLRVEPGGRAEITQAAVSALPSSLTRLDLGCSSCPYSDLEIGRGKGLIDDVGDNVIRFIANLPPSLLQFDTGDKIDFSAITMLPLWSNLRSLSINSLDGVEQLPPKLEYLFVLHPLFGSNSSLSCLPKSLKQLEWARWSPSAQQLKELPRSLEYLFCSSMRPFDAPFLPPSITHLRILLIESVKPNGPDSEGVEYFTNFLQNLPHGGALSRISNVGWWTWIPVKSLGKFVYDDIRTSESSELEPKMETEGEQKASHRPFSGLGGSGWTSVGHAIALDSISLLLSILHTEPSMWYELSQVQVLQIATSRKSWKILNLLESKGKIGPWTAFERTGNSFPCAELSLVRMLSSLKKDPSQPSDHSMAEWLLDRGFSIGVQLFHQEHVVFDAVALDRLDTMKFVLKCMNERWIQLKHPDIPKVTKYLLNQLLGHALVNKAVKCFHYLQELQSNEETSPAIVDSRLFEQLFQASLDGDIARLELAKPLLKAHDAAVAKLQPNSAPTQQIAFVFPFGSSSLPPTSTHVADLLIGTLHPHSRQKILLPSSVLQWFLDQGFVDLESGYGFQNTTLLSACIEILARWIAEWGKTAVEQKRLHGYNEEDEENQENEGDDQDDVLSNDKKLERKAAEIANIEQRLIELLAWLKTNGADLSQLRHTMFAKNVVPESFDIQFIVSEFPHFHKLSEQFNQGFFTKSV